jgi:hypothetical protein
MQDCVTQPHYHLLFGKPNHDAMAIIAINKGSIQHKHATEQAEPLDDACSNSP